MVFIEKDELNCKVLCLILVEEKVYYVILKKYMEIDVVLDKLCIVKYYWLVRILGIIFVIKLMELSEENVYYDYVKYIDYLDFW